MATNKQKMNSLDWFAWILVVIGALNWGFIGASNLNIIDSIFSTAGLTQVAYIFVGIGGLYMLWAALSQKK